MGRMFCSPFLPGGSTMFDQLYKCPITLARYRKGPMLEERIAFLTHLAKQGYARSTLLVNASRLLAIANGIGPAVRPRKVLTLAEVERRMAIQRRFYCSLCPLAIRWLR